MGLVVDVEVNADWVEEWVNGDDCRELMQQVATEVETEWLRIVPRRTGNLAHSSFVFTENRGDGWEGVLDTQAYYSAFVEFGTRYMDAQYNLRTALENVTGQS